MPFHTSPPLRAHVQGVDDEGLDQYQEMQGLRLFFTWSQNVLKQIRKPTTLTIKILEIIHRPDFYLEHDVSEIAFCIRLQVQLTQFGTIDRARPCLRTYIGAILSRIPKDSILQSRRRKNLKTDISQNVLASGHGAVNNKNYLYIQEISTWRRPALPPPSGKQPYGKHNIDEGIIWSKSLHWM